MACGNYAFFNFQLLLNLWTQSCQKKIFHCSDQYYYQPYYTFSQVRVQGKSVLQLSQLVCTSLRAMLTSYPCPPPPSPNNGQIVGLIINN